MTKAASPHIATNPAVAAGDGVIFAREATHPASGVHVAAAFAQERIGVREKLSYGLGDAAANMSWNFVGGFLLFFYTNVALVPVGALGTLFLFTRVLDGVIDPLVGLVMDRTRSRLGKARPYMLFAALPFGALSVLTFWSPHVGAAGKIAYAYVTFTVLGVVFSIINTPYSALLPMMTRDPGVKNQLGSLRALGSSLGSIVVTMLTMPLVKLIGGNDAARGFLLTAVIFAVVSTAINFLVVANCRERYSLTEAGMPRLPVLTSVANLLRNPAWVATFAVGLAVFTRLGITIAVTIYYCIQVLHAPWLISVLLPVISGAMILSAFLALPLFNRFGKRPTVLAMLAVALCAYAAMMELQHTLPLFLVAYVIAHVAAGVSTTALYTMVADAVELHEWKFHVRAEGIVYAGFSLCTKFGFAIGGSCVAYVLAWANFDPLEPSLRAVTVIDNMYFLGPMAMMVLQAIAMMFYDMDRRLSGILVDLRARSLGPAAG